MENKCMCGLSHNDVAIYHWKLSMQVSTPLLNHVSSRGGDTMQSCHGDNYIIKMGNNSYRGDPWPPTSRGSHFMNDKHSRKQRPQNSHHNHILSCECKAICFFLSLELQMTILVLAINLTILSYEDYNHHHTLAGIWYSFNFIDLHIWLVACL